jgi:hypothetical protein
MLVPTATESQIVDNTKLLVSLVFPESSRRNADELIEDQLYVLMLNQLNTYVPVFTSVNVGPSHFHRPKDDTCSW